jgi:hypothetical protein
MGDWGDTKARLDTLLGNLDLNNEVLDPDARILRDDIRSTLQRLEECKAEVEGWKNQAQEIAKSNADHVKWHREMEAEMERLRAALDKLIRKIETVSKDPSYEAVWLIAQIHNGPYAGPTYSAELDEARAALRGGGEHSKHPTGDYCVYCRSQWPCAEAGEEE